MTRKYIKNMEISDVSQHKKNEDCITIQFRIEDYPYYLDVVRNVSGVFFLFHCDMTPMNFATSVKRDTKNGVNAETLIDEEMVCFTVLLNSLTFD